MTTGSRATPMTTTTSDPITTEIIRHAFVACADEMKITLMRTAHSPVIYEMLDFSCGVFDRDARLLAQAQAVPIFLGNLGIAVQVVVEDVGGANLREGDIYLINDPYETGNHLNDIATVAPVFHGGDLSGFSCTRAHWVDVGSKDPGGSIDATDVMQEGLWLRSIKLYDAGVLNEAVWRMIEYNVRFTLGDLRAQVAATRTGDQRLRELYSRYGAGEIRRAIELFLHQGEARMRRAIGEMRPGVYEAESCLDDDCVGSSPLRVRVQATVEDNAVTLDLAGSSPQTRGTVNCGLPGTLAACRIALKMLTTSDSPASEGDFEPLRLHVPERTIFNASYPAATFMSSTHLILLVDVVIKALSQAAPDRAAAGHYGNLSGFMLIGRRPERPELFVHQEPVAGGWGAAVGRDGESALIFAVAGDTRNVPAEVLETRFPVLLEAYGLRTDSGGPGRWRGGLGVIRQYRTRTDHVTMTSIMDRRLCPPWGLFGGGPAKHCQVALNPGTAYAEVVQKETRRPVSSEDVIRIETGGGGGWGDPFERDADAVRDDVTRGYVSVEAARDHYGVVVGHDLRVNHQATNRQRAEQRLRADGRAPLAAKEPR
jgi:N-methylhydantoinase B